MQARRVSTLVLFSALLFGSLGTAVADHHAEVAGTDRMVAPRGQLVLYVPVHVNLSEDLAFKPVSVAPDIWYGVTEKLTLGLIHSGYAASGFMGSLADGLCFTGEENGCPNVYNSVGLDGRFQLVDGTFSLAADGALFIQPLDPFSMRLKLGVLGTWSKNKLRLLFNPNLAIGLTERDLGNKEVLNIPVALMFAVTARLAIAAQTGLALPFDQTGELYRVPLSLGVHVPVRPSIAIVAAFTLTALAGGDSIQNGFDGRALTAGVLFAPGL